MDINAFQTAWTEEDDNLQPILTQTLNKFTLTREAYDFLNICGLPEAAAPFLNFNSDYHPNDLYSSMGLLTEWFDFLEPEYNKYVVVGSDGSGNLIALNTSEGCMVEWLDHEDYFTARFMNTSVSQLADCLLHYRNFVNTVNKSKESDEWFDTKFTDEQFNTLYHNVEQIDPNAVKDGFWKEELDLLLADREEVRSKNVNG